MRLHSDLGPHRTPCRPANACLECLLRLITALVRSAVRTEEVKGHGDPHVAIGFLPMYFPTASLIISHFFCLHPSFCVSESRYCLTVNTGTPYLSTIPADCRLKMPRDDESTLAAAAEAGEKMTASGTREDLECNEEKATSTHVPNGPSYPDQGSDDERALIFKQDLRIIPLCSFIYLLCYLDRSNVGNAKVRPPSQLPNPVEAPHFDAHHRSSTKKKATTS
jgi:hypothetical protein